MVDMRKKFKILYPEDYHVQAKQGQPYKPPVGCMVLMSREGVFFLYNSAGYYPYMEELSNTLPKYDVVWK